MEEIQIEEVDRIAAQNLILEITARRFEAARAATEFEKRVLAEAEALGEFARKADTRTYCILVVSFVEDTFRENFMERWEIQPSQRNDFFGANGPLSTFSQRITLASGMNWLPEFFAKEAGLLRKIRNELAHNHRIHSLTQEPLLSWANSLKPAETVWIGEVKTRYRDAYDAADRETQLRIRIFCLALHIIGAVVARSKNLTNELSPDYRASEDWHGMTDIEQGLIDAMVRHAYLSLGIPPSITKETSAMGPV
ncbi:hypothetical protein [Allopontixanthobacter confluentis]|uniref:hypothetical protein n=1 Tax=Allopontixanthobacter confluentis TaxID=1849021 RepID=UPI00136B25DE|nr:hypothetical protein [Allopontixanthobacter confluentis]